MSALQEKIELLSVSLLDHERPRVEALRRLARRLGLEFGWHYLLDLTWILRNLPCFEDQRIMDAGAGMGIIQWFLAGQGAEVLSVDRESRVNLPLRFRLRYSVKGFRPVDLAPSWQILRQGTLIGKMLGSVRDFVRGGLTGRHGCVYIYNHDLKMLPDVTDNYLDAVVAVSSLEHNADEDLEQVVDELMRVLKPGGLLLATLGAARDEDLFHQPSQGWCYTEASLRRIFSLDSAVPSNYDQYDELFAALRICAELRDNLASFYFRSGANGMPWGVWDPKYMPVGLCKVKESG